MSGWCLMRTSVFVGKYLLHITTVTLALYLEDTHGNINWGELVLMEGEWGTWRSLSAQNREEDVMGMLLLWAPLIHKFTWEKVLKKTCTLWVRGSFLALLFIPLHLTKNGTAGIFHAHLRFLVSFGRGVWHLPLTFCYRLRLYLPSQVMSYKWK